MEREAGEHITLLIDRFLETEKTLQGRASWGSDPDPGERRIRWPLVVGDSVSAEGVLCLTAYPNLPVLKFAINLVFRFSVARLDFCPDYECHSNPPDRAPMLGGYRICGPHYHSWADNRHLATAATLPKELLCAKKVPPQIRHWDQAFRWFCGRLESRLCQSR